MSKPINARSLAEGDIVLTVPVECVNPRGDFDHGRVIQVKHSWGQYFVWLDEGTERPADLILNHSDPLTILDMDPQPEPTLDGYATEYLTMVAVNNNGREQWGVGLDQNGNVVTFRHAEDTDLYQIARALRQGSDMTVRVAECEVIRRAPAFEVVGETSAEA